MKQITIKSDPIENIMTDNYTDSNSSDDIDEVERKRLKNIEYSRRYREKHPEKYSRRYREKHPEKYRAQAEKAAERYRNLSDEEKTQYKDKVRAYKRDNPEKYKERARRYYAKKTEGVPKKKRGPKPKPKTKPDTE